MKQLLLILSLTLTTAFAGDDLKSQALNKKVQENISKRIETLKKINVSSIELNDYIAKEESKCLKNAKGDLDLENVCYDNSLRMNEIGDLQTIIDMDIAKLTEYQTSFIFTLIAYDELVWSRSHDAEILLFIAALPLTVALDVITSPFWFYVVISI